MKKLLIVNSLLLGVVLLISCNKTSSNFNGLDGIDAPIVLSSDPNIIVTQWEYLSPEQIPQTHFSSLSGILSDNAGIVFGAEPHEALIIWHDQGFDLYWNEFPCAIKPVVVIKENAVIELFAGKHPPPPIACVAMESPHAITVIFSSVTAIPTPNQWKYHFKPSEP